MPTIMGIVNVTPDSFSGDGCLDDVERAVAQAVALHTAGANIIDIGGESTRPGAKPVSVEEEKRRVLPLITALHAEAPGLPLSIDTYHAEVAQAACAAGATIINDISGFRDPAMLEVARDTNAICVLMHMAGEPHTMQEAPVYNDIVGEVGDYLLAGAARLEAAGIPSKRIILDPGFGFGKTRKHNVLLYAGMKELVARCRNTGGYELLIGVSRKSFIGVTLGIEEPSQRDEASAQLAAALAAAGAGCLRVHNVDETRTALHRRQNPPSAAFIALGSNIGDTHLALRQALQAMDALPLTTVTEVATPVLSEPAYDTDQSPFLNTVAQISTRLGPYALFTYLQAIELQQGRIKTRANGPRNIDLDMLCYGTHRINLPKLTVPHPRLAERAFVTGPLLEIAPDYRLADGTPLADVAKHATTPLQGQIISHEMPLNALD